MTTVYVVTNDLQEVTGQLYGAAVVGVYDDQDAAEAHAERLNEYSNQWAEVQERPVESEFNGDAAPAAGM